MLVIKMCGSYKIFPYRIPKSGFKNGRNYVCERHFEGYFRSILGLKLDGCHHPTLCIISTVEYVKKILGYVKQKSKKTIFESAPWTVDFIKLIICGGCHSVTVSAFRFLNFGIRTKDTKMTKFITYRNVPKIFEILNLWNYNFYSFSFSTQDFYPSPKCTSTLVRWTSTLTGSTLTITLNVFGPLNFSRLGPSTLVWTRN